MNEKLIFTRSFHDICDNYSYNHIFVYNNYDNNQNIYRLNGNIILPLKSSLTSILSECFNVSINRVRMRNLQFIKHYNKKKKV